jgi:hypothetical protein
MELFGLDTLGEMAVAATAGIGGLAFAAQRLVKTWSSTSVAINTDGASNEILNTLQEENRLLRESERSARNDLNEAMRKMGRLEAMEARVDELKAEIVKMELRYEKQEVLMADLVRQNTTLMLKLEKCAKFLATQEE